MRKVCHEKLSFRKLNRKKLLVCNAMEKDLFLGVLNVIAAPGALDAMEKRKW